MKAARGEEAAEENISAFSTTFKGRIHLHSMKVQGGAASAAVEPVASYPEDVAKITGECGNTKQ